MNAVLDSITETALLRMRSVLLLSAGLLLTGSMLSADTARAAEANPLPPAANRSVDFRREIYPILKTKCFGCHQGKDASSGVRLDDRREILGETTGIMLVKSGDSASSRLIRLAAAIDPGKVMPPEGDRLTADEVGVLRAWIDQGLRWDETLLPPVLSSTDHWALQPVRRPAIPAVSQSARVCNPVDAFISRQHTRHGLRPASRASRRTLIRRLSLDLTGLPPVPEVVDRFLQDIDPGACERLVDRLLASPHYGERWARHWLDVARWAESEGYESNHARPFAWRYRDYVIESFNSNRPYNEFVRQQLAGDELQPYSDENLVATGFLAAARISSNEEDKWLQRNDVCVDMVNATGAAFLGLTLACAQCHNHKFDPVSTRDYYRLMGYFTRGGPVDVELRQDPSRRQYEAQRPLWYEPALALKQSLFETARRRLITEERCRLSTAELEALDTPADRRTVDQELLARRASLRFQRTPSGIEKYLPDEDRPLYERLKQRITEIEKTIPPIPQTFAFCSPVTSPHRLHVLPPTGFYPLPFDPDAFRRTRPYICIRGDVHAIGPQVEAGWPAVFDTVFDFDPAPAAAPPGSRRELAAWLTDPRNPLTARVWVNRLWQYHFGRGLVEHAGDFGLAGERPTHPELLDWLAAELVESGWSTRHIQRLIVTSATFQQASTVDVHCRDIDPENRWLWHWQPRRLEQEVLRDAMLAVSGELDPAVGGASVPVEEREQSIRRSLYLFQKRGLPPEMQKLFDGPTEAGESCASRHTSTTALQSLYLLNDRFVLDRAIHLAETLQQEAGNSVPRQIRLAYLRSLGRDPDGEELQAAVEFLNRVAPDVTSTVAAVSAEKGEGQTGQVHQPSPLALFCQVLLNLNEFAYLE